MAIEFVSATLLPRLLSASVQAVLVVAVILLLCRLLPRLAPAARALLWWLVALQLLVGVVWSSPLALPLLPADAVQPVAALPYAPDAMPHAQAEGVVAAVQARTWSAVPQVASPSWTWSGLLAVAWLLGLSFMIARTLGGYLATRRLLRESQPCTDRTLLHALQLASEAHGLRHTPRLRLSDAIDSPQLIGPWRPVLLLPANHPHAMHADELDMALTHELVHLQRRDLWWGLLPAVAQHVFFFHPLAHFAAREYALAREAACDAAVIAGNRHCAHDYGRLLVRLGVAARPSAGLASASPTFRILKRRLIMLQNTASTPRFVALVIVGVVAVLGVMPYRIIAAPTPPAAPTAPVAPSAPAAARAATPATPAPAAPVAALGAALGAAVVAPVAGTAAVGPVEGVSPPPPVPAPPAPPAPAVPAVPAALPAPPAPPAPLTTRGTYTYVTGSDQAYVMIAGDETFAVGSSQDMREAQRQQRGSEPVLWLRKDDARYVVRDPATLRKLQSIHDEMNALGQQQSRIGARQGELGEQQGALGMRQAEIAAGQARLAGEQAAHPGQAHGERMAALEAQQRGMTEQVEFLAERQRALGSEQAALGARQAAASQRAAREASRVLDQAISSGVAQPVKQ